MNTIKLTLLGIMVMLTASLRAQTQQRNWMVFQPSALCKNINFSTGSPSNAKDFPYMAFDPLGRQFQSASNTVFNDNEIISHFATNTIYSENNRGIAYIVSGEIKESPNSQNGSRKDIAIYTNENEYIYTSLENDGFEWICEYSNEIALVNIGCNKYHIISGYYLAELNLQGENQKPEFAKNSIYNLLTENFNKVGLNVTGTFRTSFAIKKDSKRRLLLVYVLLQ
jgi:hypothetical protein